MGMTAKPGETKTVFVVQGIPPEEVLKNISGWIQSVMPGFRRVIVHNKTKSSDVQMYFTQHELHVTIIDTEFKFFNEVQHDGEKEKETGNPEEPKANPNP